LDKVLMLLKYLSSSSPTSLFKYLVCYCFPALWALVELGSVWEAPKKCALRGATSGPLRDPLVDF
jgi:hypothetical protein